MNNTHANQDNASAQVVEGVGTAITFVDPHQVETSDPSRLVCAPAVSALMITYRHERYLAEAIEGVLSQRFDQPFELIIGVDAAPKGTPDRSLEIALEYQRRFPESVRVIHSPVNVGMNANSRRLLLAARGRFLAYCEGDDYWCSIDKLACEYQLINSNEDIAIVHSDWTKARLVGAQWIVDWTRSVHQRLPLSRLQGDLFRSFYDSRILRTCTVMVRRRLALEIQASALSSKDYRFRDTVCAAYATAAGRVGYVPSVTAVYRLSPNSALRSGVSARISFLQSALEFDADARQFFSNREGYPNGYRWELLVGIVLWALRGSDWAALKQAVRECALTYNLRSIFSATWSAVRLRLPEMRSSRKARTAVQDARDSAKQE